MKKSVNGNEMRDALIAAADDLFAARARLNEIDAYPAADQDTGENMSATMQAAKTVLLRLDGLSACDVLNAASKAMMNNARGNSGLLLGAFFSGMSRGLTGYVNIGGKEMARAFLSGVDMAYRAINRPVKGTFLTVARQAADKGALAAMENTYVSHVWAEICKEAEAALAHTPDFLPILKKRGIVDAGAKGLCIVLRGMEGAFSAEGAGDVDVLQNARLHYCVECSVLTEDGQRPLEKLRETMSRLGDALVFRQEEGVCRVHLHTADPTRVITEGLNFGPLESAKVENMHIGHQESGWVHAE